MIAAGQPNLFVPAAETNRELAGYTRARQPSSRCRLQRQRSELHRQFKRRVPLPGSLITFGLKYRERRVGVQQAAMPAKFNAGPSHTRRSIARRIEKIALQSCEL